MTCFAWPEEQEPCCPPDGPLNKAINYILNRRDELSCFLSDGAVPLDNNICERAIRPVVMGRKAWLFAGFTDGREPRGTDNEPSGNGKT